MQKDNALGNSADLPSDTLAPETEALFSQILLFLQEGFRQHDISKTYQVYFTPPDEAYTDDNGHTVMHCDLLLEDTDNDGTKSIYWYENVNYIFDEDSGWYTFTWQARQTSFIPIRTTEWAFLLSSITPPCMFRIPT
ncbi:MAG: hypothetical protein K2G16_05025 [Lachnospiraceae bacterium]|nr:hypothetical protein [Lachnospiraceae bacterium]